MSAARSVGVLLRLRLRSARSTLPCASQATATTDSPAMAALAGLVPCAEVGIRQTSAVRLAAAACQARMASRPAYSPCEPAFGCNEIAAKPVIAFSHSPRPRNQRLVAHRLRAAAQGWRSPKPGQVTGIISAVAFSFIVQEPSGIIEFASAMSLRCRRYR